MDAKLAADGAGRRVAPQTGHGCRNGAHRQRSGQALDEFDSCRDRQRSCRQSEARWHSMKQSFTRPCATCLRLSSRQPVALLFALAFAYLVYRESQNRFKELVSPGNEHLLGIQNETNQRLQSDQRTLQVSEEKLAVTPQLHRRRSDSHRCRSARDAAESPCPTAHRLDASAGAGRPVGEIFNIINQKTVNPPRSGNGNFGAWHDTGPGQPHPY